MLTSDGKWKWVKPVPGGITINAGELFSHMTSGYVKATIHRVHAPVDDQLDYERLGYIYFALMNVGFLNDDLILG
jgi:isopenicillin N synthase-like dioxygenase